MGGNGTGWSPRALLRRHPDPAESTDPATVELLRHLGELDPPSPAPEFRSELRAQLVAITPRLVAEGDPAAAPPRVAARPRPSPGAAAGAAVATGAAVAAGAAAGGGRSARASAPPGRGHSLGPALHLTAAFAIVIVMLLGLAVLASRNAMPGDPLYGLKLAGERIRVAFQSDDAGAAQEHLQFAGLRVDEARRLAGDGSGGPLAAGTTALITSALENADGNLATASRLLTSQAVSSGSASPLNRMTSWAPSQVSALTRLHAALPAGSEVADRARGATRLTRAALHRATALAADLGRPCLASTGSDRLGRRPCAPGHQTAAPTSPTAAAPAPPPAPATTRHGSTHHATPEPRAGSTPRSAAVRTAPRPAPRSAGSSTTPPSVPLPTLPAPTARPTPPHVTLCSISVLGIRICPSP